MGLIEELNEAAEGINVSHDGGFPRSVYAIKKASQAFDVQEDEDSYGKDLANVLAKIAERIGKEYVPIPLGKEGEPLEVGRRYFGKDGRSWMVLGFKPCAYDVIGECEGSVNTHLKGRWLSTEQPDTQERIDEDKKKQTFVYWGCEGSPCEMCPAKVDGKTPRERYEFCDVNHGCSIAMGYDLALRQAKLDGRA